MHGNIQENFRAIPPDDSLDNDLGMWESYVEDNLDCVIELPDVKTGDRIEVILPQYLPVNLWSIEEKETIDLTNYNKKELSVRQDVEGKSAFVQKFTFTMDDTSILFKWSNVRECGKSFNEKEKDYLLTKTSHTNTVC